MIPKGAQAVVVNDDPGQLRLISGLLQRFGLEVESYLRPERAIRELQKNGPVDLLVLDLHMPVLDGWKFCRLVRSEEFEGFEDMPILVVSATFSGVEVEEVSAQLGANAFLPVPFSPEVFRDYVDDLLNGKKPKYTPTALVVDDDPAVRATVGKILEHAGYRTHLAVDGREGGSMYRRIRPDLVILDYHLPDLTGEALLETIKRPGDPAVVIVVTGDTDPHVSVSVLRKGADGYVRKPFDASYLVDLAARARRVVMDMVVDQRGRLARGIVAVDTAAMAAHAGVVVHRRAGHGEYPVLAVDGAARGAGGVLEELAVGHGHGPGDEVDPAAVIAVDGLAVGALLGGAVAGKAGIGPGVAQIVYRDG
jgi:CheY-like chemotaxis protein